jgi:HPt (histidine-containing phosphotransfer) domain-containing protein
MDELFYIIDKLSSSNVITKDKEEIEVRVNDNGEIEFFDKDKKNLSSVELSALKELSKIIEKLNEVLNRNEVQAIEQLANMIKTISNLIGIDDIKSIAFKVELAARRGNLNEAVEYALKIQNEFQTLKKSLNL